MLESHIQDRIINNTERKGRVVLLGDQTLSFANTPTAPYLKGCGFDDVVSIDYNGKATVNHDLNVPLPGLDLTADVLYDGGTIEHVSNIAEGFATIVRIVKVGGLLIQAVPVNCYGESYFNIDPMFLRDFYVLNGFRELELSLYYRKVPYRSDFRDSTDSIVTMPVSTQPPFPLRTHVIYMGVKQQHKWPIVWPHQSNYQSV